MIDRLLDRFHHRLIDGFIDRLVDGFIDRLIDRLIDRAPVGPLPITSSQLFVSGVPVIRREDSPGTLVVAVPRRLPDLRCVQLKATRRAAQQL